MKNTAPHKPKSFKTSAVAASLPANFSWHNSSLVSQYKGTPFIGIISPVGNQLTCGSCYAWASSTAISDRYAIAQKAGNPLLGPTYLLSCAVTGDCDQSNLSGCNGGVISVALQNMAQPIGGVQSSCWNYDWCVTGCDQSGDGDANNSKLPPFPPNADKCISAPGTKPALYKVQANSVQTLNGFDEIKESIWNNGPIPTGYYVYADFVVGTSPASQGGDGWAATNGIYCHLDTDSSGYTSTGDVSPYKYGTADDMNQQLGAHAVVIVGWGSANIPNFIPKTVPNQKTITVPFWIVRNSWGTAWNEGGFFRIAMTNPAWNLNTTVMFDQAGSNSVGGVIDFLPDLSTAPPPLPLPMPIISSAGSILSGVVSLISNMPGWLKVVNVCLLIALIVVGLSLLFHTRSAARQGSD